MIYEHAELTIAAGRAAEFESAFAAVPAIFAQASGCQGVELRRCLEEGHYLLVVAWETLDDHTVGFRESELFAQWRAVVGPFFAEPPRVLHYAVVR
jgi:heme-degrading monooxygenase HmoA